jgi:O-antigen/teichoic acid export membrane protein
LIGRKSFLIILSRFASAGLAFVGLFFMTRYLGAEVYGSISWVLALVATFNSFADLGFGSAHIKRVSEGLDLDDCVSTYTVIRIFLTGIMVTVVLLSILVYAIVFGQNFTSSTFEIILLFLLYFVYYDIATIATTTFDARVETAKTQLSVLVDPLIRIPLVVFVSINRLSTVHLAYAYVLSGLGVAIVSLVLLSRERVRWCKPTLFRSYLKFAFPIALISVMGAISSNADKLLIGFFWSDADVGYYSSSQSVLALFAIIGIAVSTLTFPTFSKLHTEGMMEEIGKKTRAAERYISMLAMPVVAIVLLFPTEVALILFGGGFEAAAGPLRFLSVSMLLNLLNGVYASQINAVNRPDLSAKLTLLSLLINLGLLAIFIPTSIFKIEMLGLAETGAAIANMIGVAVLFVTTRLVVLRLTGTNSNPRILIHVVAGAVTGAALIGVSMLWKMTRFYDLVGYGAISVAVFIFVLYILREFNKNDVRFFLSVINPGEMRDYLSSEFRK